MVVQCLAQHGLSLARVHKAAHGLRLSTAFSKAFPGYVVAAFDSCCRISAHARRVALSAVWATVGLGDCLCDRLLDRACSLES